MPNAYPFDNDNLLTGSGGYTISRSSQNGLPTSVAGNGLTESRTFSQYGELDAWTVTVGGVDTAAISSKTLEAASVPGLYVIGELLDVTGRLGGYNLHWAYASGFAAGEKA